MEKNRWTNKDLMEFFEAYNRKYFNSKLRRPLNLSFSSIQHRRLGYTFRYRTPGKRRNNKTDNFGIHISSELRFSQKLWAGTLLHEMVHLEQLNRYSCGIQCKRFNARMAELALAGAFNGIW